KMRDGGAADHPTVETKGPPRGGLAKKSTTAAASSLQKPTTLATLPVEQLDISAPLDVTSVGSSAPTPVSDRVVSFEEPAAADKPPPTETTLSPAGDSKLKPGAPAGAPKGRGKPKKSVATVKLTELEMAKLGRLAQPAAQAGKGRS